MSDLYRMYRRFAETRRWKLEELELHPTEVGGLKEIIFAVSGTGSWRSLRFESGVHRVQRASGIVPAGGWDVGGVPAGG